MKPILLAIFLITGIVSFAQKNQIPAVDSLLKNNDISGAVKVLDSIEQHDSVSYLTVYFRGLVNEWTKSYHEAIDLCNKAIGMYGVRDSFYLRMYTTKIQCETNNRNYDAAIEDDKYILKLFPKDIDTYVHLSYAYGRTKDYKDALDVLEEALKMNKTNHSIYNNLAYFEGQSKQYKKAIAHATEGLKYTTDSIWVGYLYNNRGYAEMQLNQLEEADADMDKSMAYNPGNPYVYYFKAILYQQQKKTFEMCRYVELCRQKGGAGLVTELRKICK